MDVPYLRRSHDARARGRHELGVEWRQTPRQPHVVVWIDLRTGADYLIILSICVITFSTTLIVLLLYQIRHETSLHNTLRQNPDI